MGGGTLEQRDRSLTVMIPRAKYRPIPGSNLLTMSTFGPEQKLLKYLTPERQVSPNSALPSYIQVSYIADFQNNSYVSQHVFKEIRVISYVDSSGLEK